MAYEGKIIFSPFFDPLYATNIQTGDIEWTNWDYPAINSAPLNAGYKNIYFSYGYFVNDTTIYSEFYSLDASSGVTLWDTLFLPASGTHGGTHTRILISQDSMLWIAKNDALYILKTNSPSVLYSLLFPESSSLFSSWNFPIAYKNYFIYAHEDFLVVYEADTIADTSREGDTLSHFFMTSIYEAGKINFDVFLPKDGPIGLKVYTPSGRRVWEYKALLSKGRHSIPVPIELPSGVYFVHYFLSDKSGTEKFIVIKGNSTK